MKKSCSNCMHNYEDVDTSTGKYVVIGRFCGATAQILSRYQFPDCVVPALGGDADTEINCKHWEDIYDDN